MYLLILLLGIYNFSSLLIFLVFSLLSILFYKIIILMDNKTVSDFPVKYFVQEAVSSVLLWIGLMMSMSVLLFVSLMMKLGLPPFHDWVFDLLKKFSFIQMSFLLSLHKLFSIFICLKLFISDFIFLLLISLFLIMMMMLFHNLLKELLILSSFFLSVWVIMISFFSIWISVMFLIYMLVFSFFFYYYMEYWVYMDLSLFFCVFVVSGMPPVLVWFLKMLMFSSVYSWLFFCLVVMGSLSLYIYLFVFGDYVIMLLKKLMNMKVLFILSCFFVQLYLLIF